MMRFVLVRRYLLSVGIALGLLAILGLVILSPFALAGISHFRSDWTQLSDIGQTYGAVSAILSALALGGILASLLYQARDSRNAQHQIARTFQFELIKLELEDPALMAAIGAPWGLDVPAESATLREFLYVQMWVSYMAGSFATGAISASIVQQQAALEIFHGRAGRTYWQAARQRQLANSKGRYGKFFRLLDDEYRKVINSGMPVAGPINTSAPSKLIVSSPEIHKISFERARIIAISVFIGALAGRLWRVPGNRLIIRGSTPLPALPAPPYTRRCCAR